MTPREPPAQPPVRRASLLVSKKRAFRLPFAVLFLVAAALFVYWRLDLPTESAPPPAIERPSEPAVDPESVARIKAALADNRLAEAASLIERLEADGSPTPDLRSALEARRRETGAALVERFRRAEEAGDLEAMRAALAEQQAIEKDEARQADWSQRIEATSAEREKLVEIARRWSAYRTALRDGALLRAERELARLQALGQSVASERAALVRVIDLPGDLTMRFRWCPPGSFSMGSPPEETGRRENETRHTVSLSRGFWLGEREVSQAQWLAVSTIVPPFLFRGDDLPVENVNRAEIEEFIGELSNTVAAGSFRLPSEAEWEYACRAGTTTPFAFGETLTAKDANFDASEPYGSAEPGPYRQKTVPVDALQPNRWGFYHMHGNVWEHCLDRFGPYPGGPRQDPVQGLTLGRIGFVVRGGGWGDYPRLCRSAVRLGINPSERRGTTGLRVVFQPAAGE